MKMSRRSMLLAGLTLTQVGLLEKFGMNNARADGRKPTKLLTIYVPGGWMPTLLFCPFNRAQVESQIRPLGSDNRLFFGADGVIVSATGEPFSDAPAGAVKQELRQSALWNKANPRGGVAGYNSNGYSWVENKLWENTCVLHGIDQGTAAHDSGQISAMCGAAGAEWRAPSMQAVVANALLNTYGDTRPLPSVSLGARIYPHALDLPAAAAPVEMAELGALRNFITEKNDRTWNGFRARQKKSVAFGDKPADEVALTAVDEYVLAQTAALKGRATQQTDSFFERLFNAVKGTSKLLAADVVTAIEKTPGLAAKERPYTVEYYDGSYTLEHGATWQSQFDLALRLLRSNLCSTIHMDAPGPGQFFFDTHGESFDKHAQNLHVLNEVLGKFLGEMKATGLLEDTLVVIISEFSRTFSSNGHWPTTSVVLVGAGVTPNMQIGNYDLAGAGKLHDPVGLPVDLIDEGGVPIKRIPKSADVCATIYKAMGVEKFFIPGGYGEIVAVAQA